MLGKVLVTGATGRVGVALVQELKKQGMEIITTSRNKTNDDALVANCQHTNWDLVDSPLPRSMLRDVDTVFHLAQVVGTHSQVVHDPVAAQANCLIDRNIAMSVEDSSVRRLIFSSSSSAGAYRHTDTFGQAIQMTLRVREPVGLFGSAKLTSERLFETLNLRHSASGQSRYRVARIFTIFGGSPGKNGGIIDWWLEHLNQGVPIVVIGAKQIRNFIHIDDVISQLISLAIDDEPKATTDIASSATLTLESAATSLIEKQRGHKLPIEFRSTPELWDHIPETVAGEVPKMAKSIPIFPEGLK